MSDAWVGAAFTALGAIIGALSSSITTILQGRRQTISEMKKVAVQMALEHYRVGIQDTSGRVEALPAFALIFYYDKLIHLAARGELNRTNLKGLLRDQWELQLAANEEVARLRGDKRP